MLGIEVLPLEDLEKHSGTPEKMTAATASKKTAQIKAEYYSCFAPDATFSLTIPGWRWMLSAGPGCPLCSLRRRPRKR